MTFQDWLTASEISDIFAAEVQAAGGRVTETIEVKPLLFARSVLPGVREVSKGDRVQGGVALRSSEEEILVHPYVFRQVCTNGAIRAHAIQTRQLMREDFPEFAREDVALALHEAIRGCCAADAFADGVGEMRSARLADADMALALMPLAARVGPAIAAQILGSVMSRFHAGRDRSRFGLMNAVTSMARDTPDSELRWRLEELGGGIAVAAPQRDPRFDRDRPRTRTGAFV
jgi:hypothetical protein